MFLFLIASSFAQESSPQCSYHTDTTQTQHHIFNVGKEDTLNEIPSVEHGPDKPPPSDGRYRADGSKNCDPKNQPAGFGPNGKIPGGNRSDERLFDQTARQSLKRRGKVYQGQQTNQLVDPVHTSARSTSADKQR